MAFRSLLARRSAALGAGCAAAVTASGTLAYCSGSRVTGEKTVGSTKFLQLISIDYLDDKGVARKWEKVERAGKPSVVSVLPIISSKSFKPGEEETLLTCQFRPPHNAYCLELPAAIVTEGETLEACARRCILNETGYEATVRLKSKPLTSSAGLTSEQVSLVIVDINLDDYTEERETQRTVGRRRRKLKKTIKEQGESWVPDQSLEDDQTIKIQKIKLKDLQKELHAAEAEGVVVSYGLQGVATGMSLGAVIPPSNAPPPPPAKKGWF